MSEIPPSFRGVFHASEDPEYWQEAMEEFPNHVPRFKSKEDAVNFIKTYCQIGSNPDEPHLRQSVTVMTTWSQIEHHLLPKIQQYRNKWTPRSIERNIEKKNRYMNGETVTLGTRESTRGIQSGGEETNDDRERAIKEFLKKNTTWRRYKTEDDRILYHDKSTKATEWKMPEILREFLEEYDAKSGMSCDNVATEGKMVDEGLHCDPKDGGFDDKVSAEGVYSYLRSRLDLPIHRRMNHHSAINTLKYLFFHMRCGIYVMIRNSEVCIFAPFVNKNYRNNWAEVDPHGVGLHLESSDGSIASYYAEKENHYRRENVLEDLSEWWANGNIICNEHEKPDVSEGNEGATGQSTSSRGTQSQYWGDQFLLQLKDMLAETCRLRAVPDCEFFINKRDYPQLKVHEGSTALDKDDHDSHSEEGGRRDAIIDMMRLEQGNNPSQLLHGSTPGAAPSQVSAQEGGLRENMPVEPYGFIFDRDDTIPGDDIPLSRYYYNTYAPILSFYTSKRFADIPMPPTEDWEAACGEIFPPSFNYTLERAGNAAAGVLPELTVATPRDLFTAENLRKFDTPWESKVNTAFFRGTATGGGTTIQTNQRLHVAQICYDWEIEQQKNTQSSSNSNGKGDTGKEVSNPFVPPLLDAKITGWNMRDKKIASRKMTFVRKRDFLFEGDRKKNFVEIYKQSHYKYLLYVEGHCAACRYGFMMQLGSVILKVDSLCVADSMWYFPLLRPYYDHVPVKADLSDLREQILWCRDHDEECRLIASRAKELYKRFVGREGILDYMQSIFIEISRRWMKTLPFGDTPAELPVITRNEVPGGVVCCLPNCGQSCEHAICLGCTKIQESERERMISEKEDRQQEKQTKEQKKELLRQRMLKKAAVQKAARKASSGDSTSITAYSKVEGPPTKKARNV